VQVRRCGMCGVHATRRWRGLVRSGRSWSVGAAAPGWTMRRRSGGRLRRAIPRLHDRSPPGYAPHLHHHRDFRQHAESACRSVAWSTTTPVWGVSAGGPLRHRRRRPVSCAAL